MQNSNNAKIAEKRVKVNKKDRNELAKSNKRRQSEEKTKKGVDNPNQK